MRNRRPSPEHAEAVARRLAMLEAELDATRRSPATSAGQVREAHVRAVPPTYVPEAYAPPRPAPSLAPEPLAPEDVEWVDLTDDREDGEPPAPAGSVPAAALPTRGSTPVVPGPGRHARRRRRAWRLAGVLESWSEHVRFTPAHVTVVATVAVAALGITCWWLLVGRVEPVLNPVASPVRTLQPGEDAGTSAAPSPGATSTPSSAAAGGARPVGSGTGPAAAVSVGAEIVVDVAGKVRRPGIVVLPAGSRVIDAIEAAGGARRGVDLSPLNLARPLADGEQVLVGVDAPAGAAGTPAAGGGGGTGPTLVNINLASLDELDTLPGVGPVTAQAIVDWRTRHGGFTAVDDLLEVDGIGDATLQKLAPHVTL